MWFNIPGYNYYQFNIETHKVMSLSNWNKGKLLKQFTDKYGRFAVNLSKDGKAKRFTIKQLIQICTQRDLIK